MIRTSRTAGRRKLACGALLVALALCLPQATLAGSSSRPLGVVELFTSQGCSSCPPADAVLADLARSGDVVALAYHVDYWDYLGWRDALGSPENTARQRAYAQALDNTSIYTPQAIVNGQRDMNGARRDRIWSALDGMALEERGLRADISIEDRGDSIVITTGTLAGDGTGSAGTTVNAHVVLIDFTPQQSVEIRTGENRGKTLDYWNVVNGMQTIGMWSGAPKSFELPKAEVMKKGNGCAVLLQVVDKKGRPGPILGAALLAP
ncbi:DUF1223 domain-containing protein [Nitratireductor pacificus]|uniref:DUF1223 domain-containing protein n=1 Tax=Nitratireductor pacificus pht-3B TaxID=391937 RepID=K2MD54_9HYPH|nr:DUF1223 domain-containing protein [Nitratireductor pacificus]EKF18675.1 hypothetical protein NA2_12284 [Nitratireductor pacificus pht-3B]